MSPLIRSSVLALILGTPSLALAKAPELGALRKVGNVHLPISCVPAVQKDFDHGVALLHSFFYPEARKIFTQVATKDPKCAMAHWGIAMTLWHPIWTPPDEKEMAEGTAAMEKAKALGGKTDLERGLIGALDAFYTEPAGPAGPPGQTCHGPTAGTHRARAAAYAKAMEQQFAHQPDDLETASFLALGLLGAADPLDRSLSNQKKATEILEKFYANQKLRQHPGLLHYLIHGYDYPQVADKGLPAAKEYAMVAPWVPHALHMPSHIFVRLGMWKEVIDSNLASYDAAQKFSAANHPGASSQEELHALDYLAYAYLQTGKDEKAKEVVDKIARVKKTFPEADFAATYALGAVPARYTLERQAWGEAAALTLAPGPWWEKFPFGEANLIFARAIGAARTGKLDVAKKDAARLKELVAKMSDPRLAYFGKQAAVQHQAALASIAYAEGRKDEAVKLMREAAAQDDALGKHPVSPGSLLPVREMLGDILLEMGKNDEALAEYEACAKLNPKRKNTLTGAGLAAERAGKKDVAKKHRAELASFAPARRK